MFYSISFRRRALRVQEQEKLTNQQTADRFGVGIATISRWRSRIEPKPYPHWRKGSKLDLSALAKDVEAYPDAYLDERAERLGVFVNSISNGFKKLGVTYSSRVTKRGEAFCQRTSPQASQGGQKQTHASGGLRNIKRRTAHLPEKDTGL